MLQVTTLKVIIGLEGLLSVRHWTSRVAGSNLGGAPSVNKIIKSLGVRGSRGQRCHIDPPLWTHLALYSVEWPY